MMTALAAFALVVIGTVVLVAQALRVKGDVKTGFKMGPANFFIDAKDRSDGAPG